MNATQIQLEAGGLLLSKTKVDAEATERVVARTYRHPALGSRVVIRLASDRLGQAEDLAMEFLGFTAPEVSAPIAVQQRRSLGFAAWALINDPANARYALDLVKRMKKAARQAKAKPGHAWDTYLELAKELGKSARHFLPPFWEEVGRAFKDLGNATYAGRALTKSLEAERVHALASDRARRRDVVLEFVLSGCLSGASLSEYGNDLRNQYPSEEAYTIFRDLCLRRTRGGMAPWATLPKDLMALAKGAKLDGDRELESFLEEVIETPAMGRVPIQFWKACTSHCTRIVARNPAFAIALLRHTRPEERRWGDSKLSPWMELLGEWGVFEFLWEDEHRGAPPLGEPIAVWFGRVVRDELPVPTRTFDMLQKLTPRMQREKTPLPLSVEKKYGADIIDVDMLEACLTLGVTVDDPPQAATISFAGWLMAKPDHGFRNQDLVLGPQDERFKQLIMAAMTSAALTCRGSGRHQGYRAEKTELRPFPLAAGDRPGITALWREHTAGIVERLEQSGLTSFIQEVAGLKETLWPDTLRLFPDLAERMQHLDTTGMLVRTLQAGVFDEYGWPALEALIEKHKIKVARDSYERGSLHLTFPGIVVPEGPYAHVLSSDGATKQVEMHLPKKVELNAAIIVGDDLALVYRNDHYQSHFHWASDPKKTYETPSIYSYRHGDYRIATILKDGSVFFGQHAVRPGDKQAPQAHYYLHDGERFWRQTSEWNHSAQQQNSRIQEVDPHSGKVIRDSVPAWFEDTEGGTIDLENSDLLVAPPGCEDSPLGVKHGLIGWKSIRRRDGTEVGIGIDGRRCEGVPNSIGMLRQPGTDRCLPIATWGRGRDHHYAIFDPTGKTMVAQVTVFNNTCARGQVTMLPLPYWHFLKVRDLTSSKKLRGIDKETCSHLLDQAAADRAAFQAIQTGQKQTTPMPLTELLRAIAKVLPTAPPRMVEGIARIIEQAEEARQDFVTLRDKTAADAHKDTNSSSIVVLHRIDAAALHWNLGRDGYYGEALTFGEHLAAAAEFLKGSRPAGPLPHTNSLWFKMFENLPGRCWRTYWRAAGTRLSKKGGNDGPWLELLEYWQELGLAQLPGEFAILEGNPTTANKQKPVYGHDESNESLAVEQDGDRFIILHKWSTYNDPCSHVILRYSTSDTPSEPKGFVIRSTRKVKKHADPAEIAAFIAAAKAAPAPPLPSKEELAAVAESTQTSPAEVALVWLAGLNMNDYQSNFMNAELRTAMGLKTADASAARQSLRNLDAAVLEQLYDAVVSLGPAAPFAADRGPVLKALAKTWGAKLPKRLPLDAELQKRLSAIGKSYRWQSINHKDLLAAAADPAEHPFLQPGDAEIQLVSKGKYDGMVLVPKKKGQVTSVEFLRSVAQLIAMIHGETPAGHSARAMMPALIKQTCKLLDAPNHLFELRQMYMYDQGSKKAPKASEWLTKHLGKTKTDDKSIARYDDGLIVAAAHDGRHHVFTAYRPAKMKDASDLARLCAVLTVGVAGEEDGNGWMFGPNLIALLKGPGMQKLAKAILASDLPDGSWPQNPKTTAPTVVETIKKKHKLSEEAAILYLQLLALPNTTQSNVCIWNGWKAADFKTLAAELVKKTLVLEATRARAGRKIFLPGEWSDLKAPWLPLETWKLRHLADSESDATMPLGGPMVLRPFDELFAAAWQRVVDGDEPRYEEAKRKSKKK